jgi:hypothetical protein
MSFEKKKKLGSASNNIFSFSSKGVNKGYTVKGGFKKAQGKKTTCLSV